MVDVYIVGSKGIPAQYGGFETFVEELTKGKKSSEIKYHVSCMDDSEGHFEYNGADCFNVKVPLNGALGRIFHVSRALKEVERCIKHDNKTVVYVLGCRIGPLMRRHYKKLHRMGAKVFVNPDGLEWKRDKWNFFEKKILRYCEQCLVENCDLVVCDSKNIERYIRNTYEQSVKNTTYIAYGSYLCASTCSDEKYQKWLIDKKVSEKGYYLIVGRFVPENNYETMITEFMESKTEKDLVIITNVEKNKFYDLLIKRTCFDRDPRIKFVGTVYDQELLRKIREEAYGYIHGHEVGGTNPSLLEALGSTKINLLLNIGFNSEVGGNAALYWDKGGKDLSELIERADCLGEQDIADFEYKAKQRIKNMYSWKFICDEYERLFLNIV